MPSPRSESRASDVTALLVAWGAGDESALDRLVPLVHAELRRLAQQQMANERPGHTLQVTALVNEAYLRLVDLKRIRWQDRAHFLAMSAKLMRRILVDHARSRGAAKRGAGHALIPIDEVDVAVADRPVDLIALNEALDALASADARKAQIVEMRFFGGLSVEETAEALGVSAETVKRDWRIAKTRLLRELTGRLEP